MFDERVITRAIVETYLEEFRSIVDLDVAVVGSGPSGLVAARELARRGYRVAVFEKRLSARPKKPTARRWPGTSDPSPPSGRRKRQKQKRKKNGGAPWNKACRKDSLPLHPKNSSPPTAPADSRGNASAPSARRWRNSNVGETKRASASIRPPATSSNGYGRHPRSRDPKSWPSLSKASN
ncbi:MAG: NAD(P)-binding protein [Brockia lithotrophica]|nr:NAD(P)-binding protein [Brockia lithotrophica]